MLDTDPREVRLLEAARAGDGDAFGRLVEPHRRGLHAHCYRMLASLHDADDALQDTLLRAWRGLPRFEGRSSLRTWLYTIATNACLKTVARRPAELLPLDASPPATIGETPGRPLVETVWIEPYPDDRLGPDAQYEQRESGRARVRRRTPAPAPAPARRALAPPGARLLGAGDRRRRWRRASPP